MVSLKVLTHYNAELPLCFAFHASPYSVGAALSHTTLRKCSSRCNSTLHQIEHQIWLFACNISNSVVTILHC